MDTLQFRPLRRVKKTGKIVVASYQAWSRLPVDKPWPTKLIIIPDYQDFPKDELVYNHKGDNLFYYPQKPEDIPIYQGGRQLPEGISRFPCAIDFGTSFYFMGRGFDCNGIPTFSHFTAEHIVKFCSDLNIFEPLTVGMVNEWYGWLIINRLSNAHVSAQR